MQSPPASPRRPQVKHVPKKIGLFLDGTWNEKTSQTNVWNLYMQMADASFGHVHQIRKYFVGLGTGAGERIIGGFFTYGMTDIIRNAYLWLVEHYNDGDEIFLFGFSRGAWEVRALLGMLGSVGLMLPNSPLHVTQLWDRFERCSLPEDHPRAAASLHQLATGAAADAEGAWVRKHCKEVNISFVGLFDVVSAERHEFLHKDGANGKLVRRVCHAMALDEFRKSFQVEHCEVDPDDINNESREATLMGYEWTEQRWFVGSHCNVGGSIPFDELHRLPLKWIRDCAEDAGLAFRHESDVILDGEEHHRHSEQIFDSMSWPFMLVQLGQKHIRTLGSTHSLNETIDASVFERYQDKAMMYAPRNLEAWAEARKVDLNTISIGLRSVATGELLVVKDTVAAPAPAS
ncbi:hypothetical protein SDRG_03271 [Saprolegnia diclina VS20]|uniref:T6SS Phospholipase effector Tle1-like catalytic domain-containing protein n=1 Tax=Saprolegnia diclina (strain VS20) TaxID=1156394 RepID=T0S2B4_SAPDV|nr:hypothetical protein SDRG_03271 [Saprolegnia diclina VS20]EQC39063.1 hypothetical protein SDRG_03271 [Saprolegnia diclina VS20]|eukprot:XP_008607124.1 hypothetical protein SDRG_03271 [Saprolegnia diclina VS20]